MGIPIALVLGVFFWILISVVKYWYRNRTQIKYTHKLDDKVLEELRKPPKGAFERITKRMKERNERFIDEPEDYPFKEAESGNKEDVATGETEKDGKAGKKPQRPLTIFEEIDLMEEKGIKKRSKKYTRDMLEDPLTRLYKELQEERKKQEVPPVPDVDEQL